MLFYIWCFNIHLFVSIFNIFMQKWLKLRAQRNVSHTTGYLNCLMLIYLIPMEIGKDGAKSASLTSAVDFIAVLFKFISTSFCGWLSDNYTFIKKWILDVILLWTWIHRPMLLTSNETSQTQLLRMPSLLIRLKLCLIFLLWIEK